MCVWADEYKLGYILGGLARSGVNFNTDLRAIPGEYNVKYCMELSTLAYLHAPGLTIYIYNSD